MELHLKIVGGIMVLLAGMHLFFPGRFNWKKELSGLSLMNRQLMYVHTFFVALTVLLMGLLCLCFPGQLLSPGLGRYISFGLAIFWGFRLLFQFFVFSPALWKGKVFETSVHILFTICWTYFTLLFLTVFLQN